MVRPALGSAPGSRDYLGRSWIGDRFPAEPTSEDGRFMETEATRPPPMAIDKALRENCYISGKCYFVAVLHEDGQTITTYSAPNRMPDRAIPNFFNGDKFIQWTQKPGMPVTSPSFEGPDFSFDDYHRQPAPYNRRRAQGHESFEGEGLEKTRKRQRPSIYRQGLQNDDDPQVTVAGTKRAIRIGDSKQVWDFYDQRFKNLQQTACKSIAKAWVKLVEPKKQSTHPYTGSDERAPDWWPRPWGPGREEKVRHKEPDHLYKRERVHLLNHILRMIVDPNPQQHPDIRKLNLTVAKLEEVTNETMSSFFADKTSPNNAKKKPYLKEIFRVARKEEQFKNGEIDAETLVYVMADDKVPDDYQSDDNSATTREDDEQGIPSTSSVSPQRTAATQSFIPSPQTDHSSSGGLHGGPFMSNIPVRGGQFPAAIMPSDMGTNQHPYVETSSLGASGHGSMHQPAGLPMHEFSSQPQDTSRRPSLFSPPTEYGQSTGAGMYSGWQQGTSAPTNSTLYTFTPQQHSQPQPPGPFSSSQPGVPLSATQQYLEPPFDGMPRGPYDQTHNSLFRSSHVGSQDSVAHPQGFPSYVSHDNRGLSGVNIKEDALGRGTL